MLQKFQIKREDLNSETLSKIIFENYDNIIAPFYEMQTSFLAARYKMNKSIETSNILTLLGKNLHLEILRQREKELDFDISLANFYKINSDIRNNLNSFKYGYKIVSIVEQTGIPKETVRRKLKKLIEDKIICYDKDKKIYYFAVSKKNEEVFRDFIEQDIKSLARFICVVIKFLGLDFKIKFIENEIKSHFSFYYYHYYSCQLEWMKMWQYKLKDVDLVFIAIQALIPTLKYSETDYKNMNLKKENLHSLIGKANNKSYKTDKNAISASSISLLSGIPRATCLRKLDKLVSLGLLVKEVKTKGYFVNQIVPERTKNITKKENIFYTIKIFSNFLTLIARSIYSTKN